MKDFPHFLESTYGWSKTTERNKQFCYCAGHLQSLSNTVAVIAHKLRNCRIVRASISPFSMDIKRNWIKPQPLFGRFGSNCVNRGHATIRHRPEANRLVDARSSAIMCPNEPHLLPCYPCPLRRCSQSLDFTLNLPLETYIGAIWRGFDSVGEPKTRFSINTDKMTVTRWNEMPGSGDATSSRFHLIFRHILLLGRNINTHTYTQRHTHTTKSEVSLTSSWYSQLEETVSHRGNSIDGTWLAPSTHTHTHTR